MSSSIFLRFAKPNLVFYEICKPALKVNEKIADKLDLPLVCPRCDAVPDCDVVPRDYSSISGGRRTITRQRSSRSDGGGDKSGSAACLGSSSTHGSGPRADSAANIASAICGCPSLPSRCPRRCTTAFSKAPDREGR